MATWVVLGILCFHLYASSLPQVYVYMQNIYRDDAGGYAPISLEYAEELKRGLSLGLGGTLGVLAAMTIMGLGFVTFCRRHALYCLTLLSPLITTATFVLCLKLIVLPRSFLWGLPVAFILAVAAVTPLWQGAGAASKVLAEPWRWLVRQSPMVPLAVLFLLSMRSLPAYYRTPKQPNRESLNWVLAQKKSEDLLVAVFVAEWGVRFYGPGLGLREGKSFWAIRSQEALQDIENNHPGKTVWLLTTLPRALHLTYPALERYISDHYQRQQTFPATIGGGEISVWRRSRSSLNE